MNAYIDIITAALPTRRTIVHCDGSKEEREVPDDHLMAQHALTDKELREIGKFTRENVLRWMESHKGVDWFDILTWGPIHDFHAVCGDVDIPWAAEESRRTYESVRLGAGGGGVR